MELGLLHQLEGADCFTVGGSRQASLTNDPPVETVVLIEEKAEQYPEPGGVSGSVIVEIRSRGAQPGKAIPGNRREIVVLGMIADVETQAIQEAVVAISLLPFTDYVMFLYPARPQRMKTDREEDESVSVRAALGGSSSLPNRRMPRPSISAAQAGRLRAGELPRVGTHEHQVPGLARARLWQVHGRGTAGQGAHLDRPHPGVRVPAAHRTASSRLAHSITS